MQTVAGRSYSVGSENDPEVRMEREVSVLTHALYWSDVPSKHNTRVLPDNVVFITSRGCRKLPPQLLEGSGIEDTRTRAYLICMQHPDQDLFFVFRAERQL